MNSTDIANLFHMKEAPQQLTDGNDFCSLLTGIKRSQQKQESETKKAGAVKKYKINLPKMTCSTND